MPECPLCRPSQATVEKIADLLFVNCPTKCRAYRITSAVLKDPGLPAIRLELSEALAWRSLPGGPYRIRRIVDAIRAIEDFRSRNHDEVAMVLAALIPSDRGFTQGYRSDLKCLSMDLLAPVVRGTAYCPRE